MNRTPLASLLALCAAAPAVAQSSPFQAAPSTKSVAPGVSSVSCAAAPASFLVGTDDCNAPHQAVGTGDQLGVPFVTGTIGSEGQNEANCYAFGMTGVDNDVWFDWTAGQSGLAQVSACGGTSVDTKIAAWPFSAGCPADGTSLACNDDTCGFQSTTTWTVSAGTSYTIQVGTFPGASGGSGTFDITQPAPPLCGIYDDGTAEQALGLTAGGEIGWLQGQTCLQTVDRIETSYGVAPCPPINGLSSRIACYEDSDCDDNPTTPSGGATLMWSLSTVVTNACTNVLNSFPYPGDMGGLFTNAAPSGCTFVMATLEHSPGEFGAPLDHSNPYANAWVVGQTPTASTLDVSDLSNNNVPPLALAAIGFPSALLLRAHGTESAYTPLCFGGAACPCGNTGPGGGGCANSTGTGAILGASGAAGITTDTLALAVVGTPDQPGVFFQGDVAIAAPPTLGDGLRCCGQNLVRIGVYLPSGNATDTASGNQVSGIGPPVSAHPGNAGLMPGDSRCYQWWYRDPSGGPCGSGFSLSNAVEVTWNP